MRNLAIRLVLLLCRWFTINPVEQMRLNASSDAVERGAQWERFYREQGGLADMLEGLRRDAFEAAQEATAGDDQTRLAWMLQDRAYRQLKGRIEAVVATGKYELSNRNEVDRMAALRVPKF